MSSVGGASSPLYGFSFVKMASLNYDEINQDNLKEYNDEFKNAVATRGKVSGGEKTMYDVLQKTSEYLENNQSISKEQLQQLADDTKDLEATKDRAAYFTKYSIGHIDQGTPSM